MFSVSVAGLRNLAKRRSIAQIALELIQNSLDAGSTRIEVRVTELSRRRQRTLGINVEDNAPRGWVNLDDAYTLFNPSAKGPTADLRGRFNLGEKLFIALTNRCEITSVSGGVLFEKGRRSMKRPSGRTCGTMIEAEMLPSLETKDEVVQQLLRVIVPPGVEFFVNSWLVEAPEIKATAEVVLPTEMAGADGVLRGCKRSTRVDLLVPGEGVPAMLYEMGIPICESGDRFHYNVHQRVPLGMDREAPKASYWRAVRAAALEAIASNGLMDKGTVEDAWVREALEHREISAGTVRAFADAAFGGKAVTYDLSDPESNHLAVAAGYRVVHGGSLTKQAWEHIRKAEAILPAGQVTPAPKPYSPDGVPLKTREPLDEERPAVNYICRMAEKLMGRTIRVTLAIEASWPFRGTYGPGFLTINLAKFPARWWDLTDEDRREDLEGLLIHEFGHEYELNHLSDGYYRALTKLGARLARLLRSGELC